MVRRANYDEDDDYHNLERTDKIHDLALSSNDDSGNIDNFFPLSTADNCPNDRTDNFYPTFDDQHYPTYQKHHREVESADNDDDGASANDDYNDYDYHYHSSCNHDNYVRLLRRLLISRDDVN